VTAPGDGSSLVPDASDDPDAWARELAASEGMPWPDPAASGRGWEDVPLEGMPEPPGPVDEPAPSDAAQPAPAKESQATTLVRLAQALYELHVDADGTPWAEARERPGIVVPLRGSGALRSQLAAQYMDVYHRAAGSGALTDALAVLEGYAQRLEPVPVELRSARRGDALYVDLGMSGDGRAVEVSGGTWRVVDRAPVLFRRTKIGRALPVPQPGTLDDWRPLLNVDEAHFRLVVGWLLAAYVPDIPRPILALFGQQGSAKTTALRQLVRFVDPSDIPTRTMPKEDAWAATGASSYVIGLDNVSSFAPWAQDALCKAVTGESVAMRALYTNNELATVHFRRAIALTGITPGRLQGDLADRLLPVELDPVGTYRSDAEVEAAFDAVYARTFGALLDLLARVLVARSDVVLSERARMADFAIMLKALDAVTGWTTLRDYLAAHDDAARAVVDADPFASAVVELVQAHGAWSGTAAELVAVLPVPEPRPRTWPATAEQIGTTLRRVTPALAASGVTAGQHRTGHALTRVWTLTPASDAANGNACRTCGLPLDPALGFPTHPGCE
jgi:hypothetical protein